MHNQILLLICKIGDILSSPSKLVKLTQSTWCEAQFEWEGFMKNLIKFQYWLSVIIVKEIGVNFLDNSAR